MSQWCPLQRDSTVYTHFPPLHIHTGQPAGSQYTCNLLVALLHVHAVCTPSVFAQYYTSNACKAVTLHVHTYMCPHGSVLTKRSSCHIVHIWPWRRRRSIYVNYKLNNSLQCNYVIILYFAPTIKIYSPASIKHKFTYIPEPNIILLCIFLYHKYSVLLKILYIIL